VSAFLIESQTGLRPDLAQESVQLLRQIAAQSAGRTWVVEVERGIDPISISVNVFWFLSLVFSLTTALVGIVSLQWIRFHMRSLSDGADSLGLSYMHSRSLQQSHIPLIFTSLPVILIFGLTFFLIGLIIFLFERSWPVAIPVTFAIVCTFAFLLITTFFPALQPYPSEPPNDEEELVEPPSEDQKCFPSPYRSPQSCLFLRRTDWGSRSKIWLQHRRKYLVDGKKPLGHLESIRKDTEVNPFAYDTIKALLSVQESRSAESEKERTALAKCLAEVLPIHLDVFPTGDLADLIPHLPPSEYVPSPVFLGEDSATREDLSALAFLKIATCKGHPFRSTELVRACVRATRWLFERPRTLNPVPKKQPLHLISKPGTSHLLSQHDNFSLDLDKLSPDALEALIDTLSRFFTSAADFRPNNQIIGHTTHTSPYTYWFLVLSAKIFTERSLSEELWARHSYILGIIAVCLGKIQEGDYLFYTASIYASKISTSPAMRSSKFCSDFLRAVKCYRDDRLKNDPNHLKSLLRKAVNADEVAWVDIDQALEALGASDTAFTSDSHGANDTMAAHPPLAHPHDQNPTLAEGGESGGRTGDAGESPMERNIRKH